VSWGFRHSEELLLMLFPHPREAMAGMRGWWPPGRLVLIIMARWLARCSRA
jgi:hypothetical protein